MRLELQIWGYVVLATFLSLPVVALVAYGVAVRRARRGDPHPYRTAYAEVFAVAGTIPWLWMILTPGGASGVTLLPFSDLAELATAPPGTVLAQVGGNLLVFASLGALLPVRSPRFAGVWRVTLLAAALSVTVEAAQYVLDLGRISSVDDVLLNSAGAALASLATLRWHARPTVAGSAPR
ncbi:hypothetical protein Ssi03_56590 [Sphaerisporangium siamense]|uniref:VanZ family protein n=1 Tax=Sphaerisporangium siamense TaxID=795645 RepID=A0A7W7G958_9ACTN|nr:VanZ family protein [Sphaerisporangium siamense]MBB4700255.1 VanZ family protein [Sphaerisporangium siamense]GII87669.1 hypothetical protein Ssi03_56590 [Sphaerisporangium siamense]